MVLRFWTHTPIEEMAEQVGQTLRSL